MLKNAFKNAKIETITLLDEHTLALTLTGPLDKEDESNGLLEFNKDCFKQDGEKQGRLMVDVSSPLPYFAEGIDNVHLNKDDTAVLQFSIDTAQFSQTADASSFTFDDPAIQPANLTIPSTSSGRDGLLEVRVNGAESKTDVMNALRGTTMTIDSAALNCDSLTLPLKLEAVSYTHLDVYKRQVYKLPPSMIAVLHSIPLSKCPPATTVPPLRIKISA